MPEQRVNVKRKAEADGSEGHEGSRRQPAAREAGLHDVGLLQRSIGNRAVAQLVAAFHGSAAPSSQAERTPVSSTSQPCIQREVRYHEDLGFFYSTYAEEYEFSDEKTAQEFDSILDTLNRYDEYIGIYPLGYIPTESQARFQSFQTTEFPSWIPAKFRNKKVINDRYLYIANRIHAKKAYIANQNVEPTQMTKQQALDLCDFMINESIDGADTLKSAVNSASSESTLFGYKYQVYDSIRKLSEFKLTRVEVEYGKENPRTNHHPRVDYEMVERLTQSTQDEFYSSQFDFREKTYVDNKAGYNQSTGVAAEGIMKEFRQYGGTAMDEVRDEQKNPVLDEENKPMMDSYGGIEGKLHYSFYRNPPQWFQNQMSSDMGGMMATNPHAFPGGVTIADRNDGQFATITPPNADAIAHQIGAHISDYLFENNIFAQLPYDTWESCKEDMSFDEWKNYIFGVMKEYNIPFPTL